MATRNIFRASTPRVLITFESLVGYDIKYIKACDYGHTIAAPNRHSDGEYQIEIVIQKL